MPVYNTERWVEKSIRSVINGGHDNIEIIVINDGSTDRSSEIIEKLVEEDSRIIYINREKNEGLHVVREVAIEYVTGEYITFVDSDDYIAPNAICKMLEIAVRNNSDMVYCDYVMTYNDANNNKVVSVNPLNKIISNGFEYIRAEIPNYLCIKLFKFDLLKDIKYQKSQVCEDAYMMIQIVPRCNIITYLKEPLYYYYQGEQSIMRSSRARAVGEWLKHALQMIELLKTVDIPDDIKEMFHYMSIHTIYRFFKEGDRKNEEYNKLARELIRKSFDGIKLRSINSLHRIKLIVYIIVMRLIK